MLINQKYGLRSIESDSTERGISVFGGQLKILMLLHFFASTALSLIRMIINVVKGDSKYEIAGAAVSRASVLLMPYTLIVIILYAFIFL